VAAFGDGFDSHRPRHLLLLYPSFNETIAFDLHVHLARDA